MTLRDLAHAQGRMLLLGRMTATERVANFLLEMSERRDAQRVVDLPMSRIDIADYLGLTIETVSRTLTQLENSAAIALPSSRRVVLRNQSALARLNA
jgi:CRP/FNR family nitrogen fixation transcriptional regulator